MTEVGGVLARQEPAEDGGHAAIGQNGSRRGDVVPSIAFALHQPAEMAEGLCVAAGLCVNPQG